MSTKAGKAGGMKLCIWVRFRLSAETGCTPGMSSNGSRNTARLGASLREAGPVCLPFSRSRAQVDQLITSTIAQVTHWNVIPTGDRAILTSMRTRSIDRRFPLVSAPPSVTFRPRLVPSSSESIPQQQMQGYGGIWRTGMTNRSQAVSPILAIAVSTRDPF